MVKVGDDEARLDICNSIQTEKEKMRLDPPLLRSPLSVMNLELCTESLGSETGSDGFSSDEEFYSHFSPFSYKRDSFEEKARELKEKRRKKLTTMSNHCFIGHGRYSEPPTSFPPPLSSAFIQMRPLRCDGRLILEAISVPFHNYLRAERHSGRLVLSFISQLVEEDEEDEEEKRKGEEEYIQVVDRGTVKVSTKEEQANGGVAAVNVLRSSLLINTFAVGAALDEGDEPTVAAGEGIYLAAAAMVAATIGMSRSDGFHYYYYIQPQYLWSCCPQMFAVAESKMLFRLKRRSKEEMLRDIRRCRELRRLLFIFKPPLAFVTLS